MLNNYLKSAIRFLFKNKGYTLLNLSGLIVGISFSCMLFKYVSYELSFDKFHEKADRTYRVMTIDNSDKTSPARYNVTAVPVGPELAKTFPEIEKSARLYRFMGQVVFNINGENFMERDWYMADSTIFDIFDYEFLHGDKSTALTQPSSIVISEAAAIQYFGETNVVGQMIEKTNLGPLKVTGVLKTPPVNSHLFFNVLVSTSYNEPFWKEILNDWTFDLKTPIVAYTYVVVNDRISSASLTNKLSTFERTHFGASQQNINLQLQPLSDIYLHSDDVKEEHKITRYGNMSYIYIFSSMGVLLMLLVSVNYINLTTTRAISRAREIGVRKVAGAQRRQLIFQYMTESLCITQAAMLISIGVMDLSYPFFNQITGRDFDISLSTITEYLPALIIVSAAIGLVAGCYPALYLSGLKPVASLRGNGVTPGSNGTLRQVLVVTQFALSITMIISTLVVGRQMNFIQSKDLGFRKDNMMVVDINSANVRSKFETMKAEYLKIPGVTNVATSSRVPGEWKNIAQIYAQTNNAVDSLNMYFMGFDEDMLDTYHFRLTDGRFFTKASREDSTHVLLNQEAAKALSLNDPIGKQVTLRTPDGNLNVTIIGVLENFNFQSLHARIQPMMIGAWNNPVQSIDYFTLRFSGDVTSTVEAATTVHNQFDLRTPIEFHFLDEQLQTFYDNERRASMIFQMGAAVSIFVACLGLSGLAAYNIQRRVKEMGIRKILGASPSQIFILLSSTFMKQILVAFLIAIPVAYIVMNKWLEAFQYRIGITVGVFLVAGASALTIALLTISFRTLVATRTNPVDTLRHGE
ncbi:ABC transporter permease [Chryseolinea sp. T2]|uniref:ABC transporter permease n=1 Tax=Chryseolinea sp. T2 TaxID=3129255 RepID=UPI003077932B